MAEQDRKTLIRQYKETPRPMGVYRVHNTAKGKSLVGSSPNLPGILNRHRFELRNGNHRKRTLQADWNEQGPDAFEFEILDVLKPKEEPDYDPSEDLAVLLQMWTERLTAPGETLY